MNAEHITPPPEDNVLTVRQEDFEDLLDRAAERGAERALVHLGLEGPNAAEDIRELRDLLEAWRDARRTAWRTVICRDDQPPGDGASGCGDQVQIHGRLAMIETLLGGLLGGVFRLAPEVLKWFERKSERFQREWVGREFSSTRFPAYFAPLNSRQPVIVNDARTSRLTTMFAGADPRVGSPRLQPEDELPEADPLRAQAAGLGPLAHVTDRLVADA